MFCIQAYEALHPNAPEAVKPEADAQDLAAALEEEVADLKDKSNQLFSYHKTGVPGLVFITLREDAGMAKFAHTDMSGH
jgi:hypothetical protein